MPPVAVVSGLRMVLVRRTAGCASAHRIGVSGCQSVAIAQTLNGLTVVLILGWELIEKAVRIKEMVGARPYHRRIPDRKEIRRC